MTTNIEKKSIKCVLAGTSTGYHRYPDSTPAYYRCMIQALTNCLTTKGELKNTKKCGDITNALGNYAQMISDEASEHYCRWKEQ